ncbi:signal peptidase II [Candidatus Margulisiibacteriota bacterium]
MFYIVAALLIGLDQCFKLVAAKLFQQPLTVIHDFFYLAYLENRGAAFGMLPGGRWLFIAVSIIVIVLILRWQQTIKDTGDHHETKSCHPEALEGRPSSNPPWTLLRLSLLFLLAGASGNLIDRIWHGYVIDFMAFTFFPAFNLADVMINLGAFGLILWWLKNK